MRETVVISIVLPTFNRAEGMADSLGSIQAQRLKAWELVVVDDGSTDDTAAVVASFAQANPSNNVVYFRQENQGPAAARNAGVERAAADNIVYLDSDDCFYASALDDIVHVLEAPEALYGLTNHNRTIRLLDQKGREVARKFDASGQNKDVTLEAIYDWAIKTTSSGLFHRKEVFEKGARWRSGFWIEDLEFMMQLAVLAPAGFRHMPKTLVDYVQTYGADGLCSRATYLDWAQAFERIYELHKNDPLMKNPQVYTDRVGKYRTLHAKAQKGEVPPPAYKYFPGFYEKP